MRRCKASEAESVASRSCRSASNRFGNKQHGGHTGRRRRKIVDVVLGHRQCRQLDNQICGYVFNNYPSHSVRWKRVELTRLNTVEKGKDDGELRRTENMGIASCLPADALVEL